MTGWADAPLWGLDFEATTADPMTARPVSFALVKFACQSSTVRYGLVDPEIPIPEESIAIHGITDEMVKERGGNLESTLVGIAGELMLAESSEIPLVVMNAAYDLTVLDQGLKRLPGSDGGLREIGWNGLVIDPMVIDRKLDKYRSGRRNLGALCAHYGVELAHAHSAADDALATIHVARAIAEEYPSVGGIEPYLLHAQQWRWHKDWAEEFSEYRVKKGQEPLGPDEGDWPLIGCKKLIV